MSALIIDFTTNLDKQQEHYIVFSQENSVQWSKDTHWNSIEDAHEFIVKHHDCSKMKIICQCIPSSQHSSHLSVLALGDSNKPRQFESAGSLFATHLYQLGAKNVTVILPESWNINHITEFLLGLKLNQYRFQKYLTTPKDTWKTESITLVTSDESKQLIQDKMNDLNALVEGMTLARDLVSEPSNILNPPEFARRIGLLEDQGLHITIVDEKEMAHLNMNALLGVGQGSSYSSHLAIIEWNPLNADTDPIVFAGKGVCFDTGGISIKPSKDMHEMKFDMGGAAAVCGLMLTLAKRNAPTHAIGIVGLVENMPDGTAQRPGDVVRSMSGQTIEILNTDAEGRLVLADVLTYVQTKFKPKCIIDLATLTGAILVSLGTEHAGLFSNNDDLSNQLIDAGSQSHETLWQQPMGEAYDRQIDSPIADMQNIGPRWGGSITAAQFLKRFIQNDCPWAHLDIAGTAWTHKNQISTPKGATGYGVRLLNQWLIDHIEIPKN